MSGSFVFDCTFALHTAISCSPCVDVLYLSGLSTLFSSFGHISKSFVRLFQKKVPSQCGLSLYSPLFSVLSSSFRIHSTASSRHSYPSVFLLVLFYCVQSAFLAPIHARASFPFFVFESFYFSFTILSL